MSASEQQEILDGIGFWIRKGAHMGVYFVLAILIYRAVCCYMQKSGREYGLSFLICAVYSVSDELHQYFVPGRSCELRDILIDSCGALAALLLLLLLHRISQRRRQEHPYLVLLLVLLIAAGSVSFSRSSMGAVPHTAEEFGITELVSSHDEDGDGLDDYTELVNGARNYLETHTLYKNRYYEGGYPTDGYGVCTDVIWYAFQEAGYSLKDLVDEDIEAAPEAYTNITVPDPNIDFRRVVNLNVYFQRHLVSLSTDFEDPAEWQPGDIVTFSHPGHIAICSDKRNSEGIPFIIHLNYTGGHEDDDMDHYTVVGHYRLPE